MKLGSIDKTFDFVNGIWSLRGQRGKDLADQICNVSDKTLSSVKYSLYMNKLPTYLTEQNNADNKYLHDLQET